MIQQLTADEISLLCIIIAVAALIIAVVLTIIHYLSGLMCGFMLGVAAGTPAWWPMLQEWFRDVMIPLAISACSLLLWAVVQGYDRFLSDSVNDVMQRF